MISKSSVKFTGDVAWMVESLLQHNAFVFIFFKTMYNKTIIRFGFCDIRNNQSRGKCYQPKPNYGNLERKRIKVVQKKLKLQAPVVRRLDNVFHRISVNKTNYAIH